MNRILSRRNVLSTLAAVPAVVALAACSDSGKAEAETKPAEPAKPAEAASPAEPAAQGGKRLGRVAPRGARGNPKDRADLFKGQVGTEPQVQHLPLAFGQPLHLGPDCDSVGRVVRRIVPPALEALPLSVAASGFLSRKKAPAASAKAAAIDAPIRPALDFAFAGFSEEVWTAVDAAAGGCANRGAEGRGAEGTRAVWVGVLPAITAEGAAWDVFPTFGVCRMR